MQEISVETEIRLADAADASSIASVLREAFAEYEALYTAAGFAATVPQSAAIKERMSEGPVWVAVRDGEVVGTVALVPQGESLYIRGMAVVPGARGRRIGKLLLEQIEAYARKNNHRRLFLSTTPFLARAISLYERCGFRRNGAGPHDLCGTPLLTMEKILAMERNEMERFEPTAKTTLKRLPKRAEYDRAAVYKILDEGFVCHVGFVVEGQPVVIPTGYGRAGDQLYIHGSQASRMLRALREGIEVCVTVTLLDGLVLARSAFHHSMNYRSVVVFGRAQVVDNQDEKMEALRVLTEHIVPGRWDEVRWPNESEMRATLVLRLPLVEASAKVRTGPPIDDEEDYELSVWAGVLPLKTVPESPINDPRLPADVQLSASVLNYSRDRSAD